MAARQKKSRSLRSRSVRRNHAARKKSGTPRQKPPNLNWKLKDDAYRFPVVGIGASAGGLDALKHLFEHLPVDTGMSFVVVQHLDPNHSSLLTEILARTTRMPVMEVTDGKKVAPDSVYVIPPNTRMAIMHDTLCLLPRSQDGEHSMPVDFFFNSLAADLKSRAIGVVLSGTASDGTHGLQAIKAGGGVTIAQDKESSIYFGMPGNAIEAGAVDLVLPPDRIATELARLARRPLPADTRETNSSEQVFGDAASIAKVYFLLRSHSGVDFSHYKPTTINRRIARRMLLRKKDTLSDYVSFLNDNPTEVKELYQDLLILVTSFFRDPGTFDSLKKNVFPRIMADKSERNPLRIWIPGCATGEEAYSVTIALIEYLRAKPMDRGVQVFATDLSESAIRKARSGMYSSSIVNDVPPDRLRRFFVKTDDGYQVSKTIRDLCVFATQDLAKDPPFSHMDLISCRNVLIYLAPTLQKRIIPMFHYALNPGGYLMLGTSESIGTFGGLFSIVDKKYRIYMKKGEFVRTDLRAPARSVVDASQISTFDSQLAENAAVHDVQAEMERIVLAKFSPPGVLVNSNFEIVRYQGQTGPFLQPAPGTPSLNILRMAREGLLLGLRDGIQQAKKRDQTVEKEKVPVKMDGGIQLVDLEIIPVKASPSARDRHFLVLFKQSEVSKTAAATEPKTGKAMTKKAAAPREIDRLQKELKATRGYLQSTIEEQESTNEELHLALEEIRSSNEELQSTNEEIETAKEELQSTNEELVTVNEELRSSNAELNVVNNDLQNLLNNISFTVVMVDNEMRIRRFTPAAGKVLSLLPSDIGRPISDLRLNFDVSNLDNIMDKVVTTLVPEEIDLVNQEGRACILRISPYKTVENQINGVILSLIDVDDERRALQKALNARKALKEFQDSVHEPVIMTNRDFVVLHVNPAFEQMFRTTDEEITGNLLFAAMGGRWETAEIRKHLEGLRSPGRVVTNIEAEIAVPDLGPRHIRFEGRRIEQDERDGSSLMVLTITKIS